MTALLEAPAAPPERVRSTRSWAAALGLLPFLGYMLVFLGGPLFFVISGAFSDPDGRPTAANVLASITEPQYRAAFLSSLVLSAVTAVIGAVFGTFLAQAVLIGRPDSPLRRIVATASGVLAYFGGVPLAFAFIAALGQTGLATVFLRGIGIDLYAGGFRIDSLTGLGLTYVYFQVPLMVILITPALEGLLPQWREAAENLGASAWTYWRHVAFPVLAPALGGATLVLFGNAFAAYATALALTSGSIPLLPTAIASALSGNVLANQQNVGLALGFDMVVVIAVVMVGYLFLQRRAARWSSR
ncbi:ABC transporter permease [Pseudonocardia xinjiangensis]|uniref:ABC transporter permease subunit n=1 Tax=Pseudonocardia xinjiangensis TaxID=75289 RepID=A0ABX1RPU0_9PSEU|nr:ABC transporter permease subunit [Pseudonocardia xinjiangensis]NMH81846.1 ABC transporter permease subunit [Pseudonocardia xinjiangensis]